MLGLLAARYIKGGRSMARRGKKETCPSPGRRSSRSSGSLFLACVLGRSYSWQFRSPRWGGPDTAWWKRGWVVHRELTRSHLTCCIVCFLESHFIGSTPVLLGPSRLVELHAHSAPVLASLLETCPSLFQQRRRRERAQRRGRQGSGCGTCTCQALACSPGTWGRWCAAMLGAATQARWGCTTHCPSSTPTCSWKSTWSRSGPSWSTARQWASPWLELGWKARRRWPLWRIRSGVCGPVRQVGPPEGQPGAKRAGRAVAVCGMDFFFGGGRDFGFAKERPVVF